jgi:hypothetical protein
MSEEYNGWSNYETWKVNLEIFDGSTYTGFSTSIDLANHMKEVVEEIISSQVKQFSANVTNFAEIFANAFIQKVNFDEIAKHYWHSVREEPEGFSNKFDFEDKGYGVELFTRPYNSEKTIFIQGDDASQFLDEIENVNEMWINGKINIDKNLQLIDNIIGNYFA